MIGLKKKQSASVQAKNPKEETLNPRVAQLGVKYKKDFSGADLEVQDEIARLLKQKTIDGTQAVVLLERVCATRNEVFAVQEFLDSLIGRKNARE